MTADDWVKIISALSACAVAIIGALGLVVREVRHTHTLVNSRMDQLLELTQRSSHAAGRLEGAQLGTTASSPLGPAETPSVVAP